MTSVPSHTSTLDEDGIEKAVCIDRLSLARHKDEVNQKVPTAENHPVEHALLSDTHPANAHREVEYVVDKIVEHNVPPTDLGYFVPSFGLARGDGTGEQAHHNHNHFFLRYWRCNRNISKYTQTMVSI